MADARVLAARLAKRLVSTRASFAAAFALAQERAGLKERTDFKVVGTDRDDRIAFGQGLVHAVDAGWYKYLLAVCVEQELLSVEAEARDVRRRKPSKPAAELQSILDLDAGFAKGAVELKGYFRLYRQTCRIRIGGEAAGTGVLLGPNLVLTAWHVVRGEIDSANPAEPLPKPDSEGRISIEFEEIALDGPELAPLVCPVTPQWLVASSPCHPDEITKKLPDATALAGLNDFAIIRLDAVPGTDRGYLDLARTADASVTKRVQIFQHPRGMKLRRSEGRVTKMYGANRFLHRANTEDGSSGAPCVDFEFRFVGLHQAGLKPGEKATAASVNRGVPITAFLTQIQPRLASAAAPMIWQLDDPVTPVVGRDDFQNAVLAAAVGPGGPTPPPQLIAVIGGTHSEQQLCRRLLDQLLPPVTDKFLPIPAASLPDRPEQLIRDIAKALGDPDAATLPLPPETDSGTTLPAWIRNQLVPAFTAAIGKYATSRRLWLVIDDLDLHTIPPGALPEFLAAVYEQLPQIPWLRIALLGFSGGVPPKALPVYRPIRLTDPTEDQVATYLERRFAKELTPDDCRATATWLWKDATQQAAAGRIPLVDALRTAIGQLNVATLAGGNP